MGSIVVGLWPTVNAGFDPEKSLAVGIAVVAWLGAEWFLSGERLGRHQIGDHDTELAKAIFQICDEDYFDFLKHHDFGGSWRENRSAPTFKLQHKLKEVRSEFEDRKLRRAAEAARTSLDKFAEPLALRSQNITGKPKIFTVVPDDERATDMFSEQTVTSVNDLNNLASELATELTNLLRAVRGAGVIINDKPPAIMRSDLATD